MATFSQILVQFFITALIKGQKGPKYGTWIAQKERIKSHTVAFICFMQGPGAPRCTVLLMSAEESCSSCAVIRVNYFDVPILLCPEVKEQSKRGLRLLCSGCECVAPTVQCS